MGKITGFLEIDKDDRDYLPVAERLKSYTEFVIPLGDKILNENPRTKEIYDLLKASAAKTKKAA